MHSGFEGLAPLRVGGERLAFWLTLVFAFPIAAAIGFFLHESIGIEQIALFIIAAMLYVTLARGRLLGSSVMIHEAQYPRVFAIVKRACASLDIPMPLVFVREDYQVPAPRSALANPTRWCSRARGSKHSKMTSCRSSSAGNSDISQWGTRATIRC